MREKASLLDVNLVFFPQLNRSLNLTSRPKKPNCEENSLFLSFLFFFLFAVSFPVVKNEQEDEKRDDCCLVLAMSGDQFCHLLHLPATTFSRRAATMVKFVSFYTVPAIV